MTNELTVLNENQIKNKIYTIRGLQVMIDSDLAALYQVETRVLNQAVRRNINRFPDKFMFKLDKEEFENWKSQFVISNSIKMGLRKRPLAFTEQGVAMLSGTLKSDTAVEISIKIIDAFVAMRRFIASNAQIFQKLYYVEKKQLNYEIKTNKRFDQLFDALESRDIKPKKGIFFDGQVFDAYNFVSDIIRNAEKSIVLVDNYVDDSILILFNKRKKNVTVTIFTKEISKQLSLDLKKYNSQYSPIVIKEFKNSHDRFLIVDDKEAYHFGASLKDLGKKWFAFSKFDKESLKLLEKLR
ncbi:MAG: ORF6N domain-containing protein [archaeon]